MARIHGLTDAQRSLVPECDREHECVAARSLALGHRERRGDHRRGRVERRAFVNVVELEDVCRDAVRERGRSGGRAPGAEHRGFIRDAEGVRDALGHACGRLERSRERGAKPVERRALGIVHDHARQVAIRRRGKKVGELACDRGGGGRHGAGNFATVGASSKPVSSVVAALGMTRI
jgi:hypothetical protein